METVQDRVNAWHRVAIVGKRPATVTYHGELRKIFLAHFPEVHRDAGEIGEPDVATFLERVAHYSAPRFNALVSLLKVLFPVVCHRLKRRPVRPKVFVPPGQKEFAALLAELDGRPRSHAGLVVRFLALSGLRIGEARRLPWANVLPEGILVTDSKSGFPRLIPFIGEMRSVLDRLRAVTGHTPLILPQASVKRALRRACERVGVRPLCHHDFRRLFATRCIECGVDTPTAAKWMGHRDGGALLGRTYFFLMDGHSKAMARRVEIAA
jgi:integrase